MLIAVLTGLGGAAAGGFLTFAATVYQEKAKGRRRFQEREDIKQHGTREDAADFLQVTDTLVERMRVLAVHSDAGTALNEAAGEHARYLAAWEDFACRSSRIQIASDGALGEAAKELYVAVAEYSDLVDRRYLGIKWSPKAREARRVMHSRRNDFISHMPKALAAA